MKKKLDQIYEKVGGHRYFPKSTRGNKIIFAAIVIIVFGAFIRYFS